MPLLYLPYHIHTDPDMSPSTLASVSLSVNAGKKARAGLSASESLSTPSVRHICSVGPRSPFGLYAACLARPGPTRFGSSADPPVLFRQFRIACRTVFADQPLVAPYTSHCHDRDPGAPSVACRLGIAFVCAKDSCFQLLMKTTASIRAPVYAPDTGALTRLLCGLGDVVRK